MKYLPDGDFEAEFLASDEALELVDGIAGEVATLAANTWRRRSGELADSTEAVSGLVDGVATGRANANDFKAHWWEFGTIRHAADPALRPAAETVTGNPVTGGDK